MNKRYTSLSFIIGLFFVLISIVLLAGYFFSPVLNAVINLYSGLVFFLFGLFMTSIAKRNTD